MYLGYILEFRWQPWSPKQLLHRQVLKMPLLISKRQYRQKRARFMKKTSGCNVVPDLAVSLFLGHKYWSFSKGCENWQDWCRFSNKTYSMPRTYICNESLKHIVSWASGPGFRKTIWPHIHTCEDSIGTPPGFTEPRKRTTRLSRFSLVIITGGLIWPDFKQMWSLLKFNYMSVLL